VTAIYAESSAVLSWLLGEPDADSVVQVLAEAEAVITSELTLVECSRALIRAQHVEGLSEAAALDRSSRLLRAAAHWTVLGITSGITERASARFPGEPLRTLDAIHLASALAARGAVDRLALLSLDQRLRAAASRTGLELLPAALDPA
jgi:predicted nucleic acid-binding protein